MEGRVVAKYGWHDGGRRFYRKIGTSGLMSSSGQFHAMETTGGKRGGDIPVEKESEKILSSIGVSSWRMEESAAEDVLEEQQLRRFPADGEGRKRNEGGWGKPQDGIMFNDEDEDGVNGGRMRPLASFDVNREMRPPQSRKLRIKLSPMTDNQSPTKDGAAPKVIRRAQDKENGGLVPLCPGTTQIRGMKRKTVSPTGPKPNGGKRNRLPFGSGYNATEQLRKALAEDSAPSPAAEIERDDSRGMDMLLMALKATGPNCERSISPSMPLPRPTVVHAKNGGKVVKNPRPATTAHLYQQEGKLDASKEDDQKSSCNDDDADEDFERFFAHPIMRPHRDKTKSGLMIPFAHEKTKDKLKDKEKSSGSDEDPDCFVDSRKYVMRTLSDCRPSQETVGNHKEKKESSREDEDSNGTKEELDNDLEAIPKTHRNRPTSKKTLTTGGKYDTSRGEEEVYSICSDDELDKNTAGPHRGHSPSSAMSLDEMEQDFEASQPSETVPSCTDDDDDVLEYARNPQGYRAAPLKEAFPKSQVRTQARKGEVEETVCHDDEEDDDKPVIKPFPSNALPSQGKVFLAQEQKFIQGALKDCRITAPSYLTTLDSLQQQQLKVIESREATGHSRVVGEEGPKIAEKSQDRNREDNDLEHSPNDSMGAKYAPGSTQQPSRRKESSGVSRRASDPQPWNYTKSRKPTMYELVFPRQIKSATASCLLETGEPSHPSVGSVVVECLPPSAEPRKEDNSRAPFSELQNRDSLWSHNSLPLSHPQSAKDVDVVWDTGKENKSWGTNAANGPSRTGVKAPPCKQVYDGCPGLLRAVRVSANSNTILGTSAGIFLHPLQNSTTHLASDSENVNGTADPKQQHHPRSSLTPGAWSITHTGDDNETHHEIAGITMQRQSWEALKTTEYFAKRRFDPKAGDASYGRNHTLPSIPSRFQNVQCHHVVTGVSNSKPKSAGAALSGVSRGLTSVQAVVTEKKVTYRRGPYRQGGNKHERLSTKVLNRNLENFMQLKDVRCPDGAIDFSRLHMVQNGDQHPPRSYTNARLPKPPMALRPRQRRGQKKVEKEKFKTIDVKTSSNVCNFKPLSEPSGLLGDFNPGIIQRVRNSVQIHAILGALIGVASCKSSLVKVPPRDSASVPVMTEGAEGEVKGKIVDVEEAVPKGEYLTTQAEISVEVQETFQKEECSTEAETTVEIVETLQTQEYLLGMGGSTEKEQVLEVEGLEVKEETVEHLGELLLFKAENPEPLAVPSQLDEGHPKTAVLVSLMDKAVDADSLHEQSDSLLTQGPSSVIFKDPEYIEEDNDEQELQPMSGTDSSPTAAGLASRWLELLTLDIKGRLSALKRSRNRVQNTLQSEELNSEIGSAVTFKPPSMTKSAIDVMDIHGSQQSVSSDATPGTQTGRQDEISSQQVDRWRALFTNMEGVLGSEATKLESWLWQIKQMQAFCPSSTNQQPFSGLGEKSHVTAVCEGLASSLEFGKQQPPQRWPLTFDAVDRELGLAASAASIMSTANFLTKVQSFR